MGDKPTETEDKPMQTPQMQTNAPTRQGPSVKAILGWIAETDRKFRAQQARIDRYADRF
jgi:hypothetical protein